MDQKLDRQGDKMMIAEALRRTRAFADLPDVDLSELVLSSSIREYRDGDCLSGFGEKADGLFVVISGCVITSRTNEQGRRFIFDFGQPGQVMGMLMPFDGADVSLDKHARGPTRTVFVPYEAFDAILNRSTAFARAIGALIARQTRMDYERWMTTLDPMRNRVAKFILWMSRGAPNTSFDVPVRISQDDLADMIGVTRPSVNKEIVALVREGVLDWHYGHIVVKDLNKLVAIATEVGELSADARRSLFERSPAHFRTSD